MSLVSLIDLVNSRKIRSGYWYDQELLTSANCKVTKTSESEVFSFHFNIDLLFKNKEATY